MTKRAALARALALDPELIFLDEPTSGLDPIAASDFDALIRRLHRSLGLTVFMITHDLNTLKSVCSRVAALHAGKIVADGIDGGDARLDPTVGSSLFRQRTRAVDPGTCQRWIVDGNAGPEHCRRRVRGRRRPRSAVLLAVGAGRCPLPEPPSDLHPLRGGGTGPPRRGRHLQRSHGRAGDVGHVRSARSRRRECDRVGRLARASQRVDAGEPRILRA